MKRNEKDSNSLTLREGQALLGMVPASDVGAKYLPLYLNEFVFRFNNRKNPRMFHEALAGC
jgi:hypothetical protein